jgi:glycosyltransferase involved in cell wall biosynthesis
VEYLNKSLNNQFGEKKKKILFLTSSLRVAGAEKVCCNLCDNLNFDLFEVYIVSLTDQIPLYSTLKNKSTIKIYTCGEPTHLKFPWLSIRALNRFFRNVKEIKPDIVHSHLWGISCIYLYLFIFFVRKPVFFATIHSAGFIYTSRKASYRLFMAIENSIYKLLNFNLIAISYEVEKMIISKLSYKTVSIVFNGVDTHLVRNTRKSVSLKSILKLKTSYPIIIHVGRASPEKRQEDIIKAIPFMLESYPDVKVLFIGRDNLEKYGALAEELGVYRNVLFLGEREDVIDLLQISNIGVFPSLYEGLPLALVEMMAVGLALVVSDIPVLKELTGFGEAAIYVPTKRPDLICEAVIKLLTDLELAKTISTNACKIAEEKYSLKSMIINHEKLYCTLIKK